MNPPPQPGDPLCRVDDLTDPGAKGFAYFSGEMMFRYFVVRRGEQVWGWRDRCPHVGTPLTMGDNRFLTRDGGHILCATHGALFRLEDGLCLGGPCVGRALTPWPVEVRGGAVFVA